MLVAGLDEEGFVGMARHVTIGGELAGELVGERGAQVFGQAGYVNEGFELAVHGRGRRPVSPPGPARPGLHGRSSDG